MTPCDSPCSLVNQQFDVLIPTSRALLERAEAALTAIQQMTGVVEDIPTVNADVQDPSTLLSPFVAPASPALPANTTPAYDTAPQPLYVQQVSGLQVTDPPTFTATRPDINTSIAKPAAYDPTLPTEPAQETIDLPAEPNPTMPTRPTLREITVDPLPDINVPDFTGTLRAAPIAPGNTFSYTEPTYASALLAQMQGQILNVLQSGGLTLYDSTTEHIWAIERGREADLAAEAEDNAQGEAAARHWPTWMPFQQAELRRVRERTRDQISAGERARAVAQDQNRIQNLTQWMQLGMQLEGTLIGHFDQAQSRILQAAWYTIQAAVAIFEQQVAEYREDREKYLADVQVMQARIQGENLRLEGAKTALEAKKLEGTLNQQDIDIYLADFKAVEETLAVDEQKLKRRRLILDINGQRLDVYGKQLQGIATKAQIKTAEYENWRVQMQGEGIKADVWGKDVSAYEAQVNGWRALIGGRKDAKEMEITVGIDAPIKIMRAQLDQVIAQWKRENERIGLVLQTGDLSLKRFGSEVSREEARTRSNATDFQAQASFNETVARLRQTNAQINIERAEKALQMVLGALQAIAHLYAQLEASMLSSVNLAAHVSASDQTSTQTSTSYNHNFSEA